MKIELGENATLAIIAAGLVILFSVLFVAMANAVEWTPTYEQAIEQSKVQQKPLMMVFYTDACGYCKKLEKETLSDPRVEEVLKDFICVHINCTKRPDLMRKYHIRGVPLVLFVSANGKKDWLVGFRDAEAFLKELQEFIGYMNR